ncbi:MAG: hypothetical protein WAO00_12335 [Chthoniobacterales bacterium]
MAAAVTLQVQVVFSPQIYSVFDDKPTGVDGRILPVEMRRDFDYTPIAIIVMELSRDVSVNLFANWLFQKFPQKVRKTITIRRREMVWNKGEIVKILEEEFTEKS